MELVIFIVVAFISSVSGYHKHLDDLSCPVDELKSCVKDITNFTAIVQTLFPALSNVEYVHFCENVTRVDRCLSRYNRKCIGPDRDAISNEVNIMEFLCHGQKKEYEAFGTTCFSSFFLKAEMQICSKAYVGKPQEILAKSKVTEEERVEFCSLSRDVFYCRYLVMEDHCGKIAARWQHTIHVASLSIPLNKFRCRYELDRNFVVERVGLRTAIPITIGIFFVCVFPARMIFCPLRRISKPPQLTRKTTAYTINPV